MKKQPKRCRPEKKNKKAFSDISALSFSLSSQPVWAVINVILLSIVRFKQKEHVLLKCHGLFNPIQVFSRFKLKGDLWTVFLFKVHPCEKQKSNVRKGRKEEQHAGNKTTTIVQTESQELELHANFNKGSHSKIQLLFFVYISQSRRPNRING